MEALNIIYINEIEASRRYSLSRAWFQRERWLGSGPPFIKLKSKILYPVESADAWFEKRLVRSTSEKPNTTDVNAA